MGGLNHAQNQHASPSAREFAPLTAGGAYVPLDPNSPVDRLAFVLKDSAPKAALTHGLARETLQEALAGLADKPLILDLDADASLWAGQPASDPDAASIGLTSGHLAYVIYTSGSTGLPKGCLLEHRNVGRLFSATDHWFHFDENDVWTFFHSVAFDFSVWEIWGALIYGGTLVVVPRATARSPLDFYELLRKEGVTVLNQTPSAFRQLIDAQGQGGSGHKLRYVVFGGEALELSSLKPWFADSQNGYTQLINMYGITETTVHVTYLPLEPADAERAGSSPIGRPIPDLRLYLLDPHGEPVPIGVSGEIYVGGAGVARGYLNRPDLTAQRFLPSPFVKGDRLYKAGDLGRYLTDGSIDFLGRNDFQVKIRGYRIELGEIEARLAEHEGIRDAVVLAREDSPGEKRLVAYYVASSGTQDIDPRALRDHLLAVLPDYMVPAAYVRLDAMPLTGNGKLDRRALPAPEGKDFVARGYEPPEGPTEETLAEIWSEALGMERVGRNDNFFELGGHSLLAIRVVTQIEKAIGKKVALRTLFSAPTVAGLAHEIDSGGHMRGSNSLLPLFSGGAGAPIFMVHWIERDLARHLGRRHPVYGLSYGLAGVHGEEDATFPEGVEAVASHYIAEMRSVQPEGPYRLIGHSAGGLIAYEMAQQLCRGGESVVFLGLLGTYAPAWKHNRQLLPFREILLNIVNTPPALLVHFYSSRIGGAVRNLLFRHSWTRKLMSAPSILKIKLNSIIAAPYEAEPYPGPVHLFVETTPPRTIGREAPPPPETGWKELALGGLDIHYVPGDHMDMVKDPLAAVAAEAIERALLAEGDASVTPTNVD
jgi:amino acid adenylation domain-containing protein